MIGKRTILAMAGAMMFASAFADTQTVDGVTWTYVIKGGEASVGGGSYTNTAVATSTSGAVEIPAMLGGCPVTSIGEWAFSDCTGLTSVTIPSGVKVLDTYAFIRCTALTSVTIPEGVTLLGWGAFWECSSLEEITIPESVAMINTTAFAYCSSLAKISVAKGNQNYCSMDDMLMTKNGGELLRGPSKAMVVIPEGVSSIDYMAFNGCTFLTSVSIPDSVVFFNYYVFENCTSLVSVAIPAGVTELGIGMFSGCTSLLSVKIPASVTEIDSEAFLQCVSLAEVTIPPSVTNIGENAFLDCNALTNVCVATGDVERVKGMLTNAGLDVSKVAFTEVNVSKPDGTYTETVDGIEWTFVIRGGEAEVGAYPSRAIAVDTKGVIAIPEMLGGCPVTSIGGIAFSGCSGLTCVRIPDAVMSIGDSAFADCTSLQEIVLPEGVVEMSDSAFYNCSSLTEVEMPSGVEAIPDGCFWNCTSLESVTLHEGLTTIGWCAFAHCSRLSSIEIPSTVTDLGYRAFENCHLTGTFVIPKNVESVSGPTFNGCKLSEFKVAEGNPYYSSPDGLLVDQRTSTLISCPAMKLSAHIPPDVVEIGASAFENCRFLGSVILAEGLLDIGESAFSGCTNLTSISFPSSVTNIGSSAFKGCSGLSSARVPAGARVLNSYVFSDCKGLRSAVIEEGVSSIGNNAFGGCSSLSEIIIPPTVASVGQYAFCNCTSLRDLAFPEGVGSLGNNVLSGCSVLTNVTVPASVTRIGSMAFANDFRLTTVNFAGDAPMSVGSMMYASTPTNLTTYVNRGTKGWNGAGSTDLPQAWPVGDSSARGIRYAGPVFCVVTFDLGNHGVSTDGVKVVRQVLHGEAAVAPDVKSDSGWRFVGWDRDFSCVTADLTVMAMYEQLPSWVATEEVGGMTWTFVVSGTNSSVGGGSVDLTAIPTSTAGVIALPAILGGYPVTGIGKSAFENCGKLVKVEIPSGVTSVSGGAFRGCTGLTGVLLPPTVTSIGISTFSGCCGLADIKLPEGLVGISAYAFAFCTSLGSVTIPASVKSIGFGAFEDCGELKDVRFEGALPSGVEDSEILEAAERVVYPREYADDYEKIVPEEKRGVSFGAKSFTLRNAVNGKDVAVSESWAGEELESRFGIGKSAKFISRYGRDLVSALFKPTGKTGADGRKLTVLDDFVAGTDPTDENSRLHATIEIGADGRPKVSWTPDLNEGATKDERTYRVMGATNLGDGWTEVPSGREEDFNFFKVEVSMPNN